MAESFKVCLENGITPDQLSHLTARQLYLIANPSSVRRLMSGGKPSQVIEIRDERHARAIAEKWKAERAKAKANTTT